MSGDGHRDISYPGASRSAFGSRLQVPAELPMPPLSTCQLAHVSPSRSANHPVSGFPLSLKKAILGSQVSALRSQVRVIRYRRGYGEIQVLNLYPYLNT